MTPAHSTLWQTLPRARPGPSSPCLRPLYRRLPLSRRSDWTEAPGRNAGGPLWVHAALRAGASPATVCCGPSLTTDALESHVGASHPGWELSRAQKGEEPALEGSF